MRPLLALQEFQLFFHMCSTHPGIPHRRLDRKGSFHCDMPRVLSELFKRPSCITSTMREIMPQVMEAEIGDEFPLFMIGLSFEDTKPVVNAVFCEVSASLRSKDVRTLLLTSTMLNVVVERTASFVQQINITELLSFMADVQPADFRADMGMLHQQVRNIAHTTPCPVPQRKERCSTQVISFLDQITQDQPLIWFEEARSKLLLCLDVDPAGRIAFQGFLFVNQPLTKVFDDGLDTGAMTHTISLFFEPGEISLDDCHRQLVGLKAFGLSWSLCDPLSELTQDTQIGINRRLVEFGETSLVIVLDPLLVFKVRERNTVCWLRHFWSLLPTNFLRRVFSPHFSHHL
jgi:hypothetical protein